MLTPMYAHHVHPILLACLLLASIPSHAGWEPVEGIIEGRVMLSGKPLAGAQVTSCAHGSDFVHAQPCKRRIEVRTDADGRFSFRQTTGVSWPTREEVRRNPSYALADPGWSYGFRVDYEGMAAISIHRGLGWARTRVSAICDFAPLLARLKAQGRRPVADPDAMQLLDCKVEEQQVQRPEE